jgi:hypothetical protein
MSSSLVVVSASSTIFSRAGFRSLGRSGERLTLNVFTALKSTPRSQSTPARTAGLQETRLQAARLETTTSDDHAPAPPLALAPRALNPCRVAPRPQQVRAVSNPARGALLHSVLPFYWSKPGTEFRFLLLAFENHVPERQRCSFIYRSPFFAFAASPRASKTRPPNTRSLNTGSLNTGSLNTGALNTGAPNTRPSDTSRSPGGRVSHTTKRDVPAEYFCNWRTSARALAGVGALAERSRSRQPHCSHWTRPSRPVLQRCGHTARLRSASDDPSLRFQACHAMDPPEQRQG